MFMETTQMQEQGSEDQAALKNLVWLYRFYKPSMSSKMIYRVWEKSKILKDYPKPTLEVLEEWIREFSEECQVQEI